MVSLVLIDVLFGLIGVFLIKRFVSSTKSAAHVFPPGPKPLPYIGNLLDMPNSHPWRTYKEYSRRYGDHLSLMGRSLPACTY